MELNTLIKQEWAWNARKERGQQLSILFSNRFSYSAGSDPQSLLGCPWSGG